jgi:hypothetical protein
MFFIMLALTKIVIFTPQECCLLPFFLPRVLPSIKLFTFAMCNGPTNALVCNKTLIQMSHTKTLKITPACFDRQMMIIIRELFDPG